MLLGRGHAARSTYVRLSLTVAPSAATPRESAARCCRHGHPARSGSSPGWYIIAGVLILIAVGLALLVSRRMLRVVRALEDGARTLGQGEVPTLDSFPVRELDDLAQTLVAAAGTRREVETSCARARRSWAR